VAGDEEFAALIAAIKAQTGADGVVVEPPYLFVITENGTKATRYWLPETLEGDAREARTYVLRPVPPNAPPLDASD
jgi:hypothetical protein